ncbi:MAG: DMT family transporter [Rubrobacter sp.]|nr:DMT family transporter [Rubrobacter sp.]
MTFTTLAKTTLAKNRAAALTEVSLILAAIFWGLNYATTKYAAGFLPPMAIVALRFAGGALILFLVLRLFEPESRLKRGDVARMAALGCFGVGTAQTCFTFGVSMTTAANTGLIFASAPIWGLVLGFLLGLERPTAKGVLGVFLSIVGIGAVFYDGIGMEGASLTGDLLILAAAIGVGGYTVLSMPVLQRYSPLAVATYPALFAAPAVMLFASPFFVGLDWGSVDTGAWLAVAYSAVFATAFAFAAWQRGISRAGANRVLVYQYLITITGVTSGIVFFGESLGVNKVIGGLVILIGVYLARRQ